MNISKLTITSLILAAATYASHSFGAAPNQGTTDLTNVALGFCEMNLDHTTGSAVFPDGSNLYKVSNCSSVLKAAAKNGYTKIVSTAATSSVSTPHIEVLL